ncbi:MAG: NUDIX hydrolase [Bacteroidetes bacterium 46-16]|mgnify:CR=1 FL=1|nr:MAG: NUDIX hydrolase [Bacteroidetes bacterium 46-16]
MQHIKLTVDAVVFSVIDEQLKVLLIQRKQEPFKGMWALPGGFVEDEEDLEPAMRRELEEETGLKIKEAKQIGTYGTPGRDPRGRTVTVAYYALIDEKNSHVTGGDDAADAQWFNIHHLPGIAFDHADIIAYAMKQLPS